VGKIASLGFKKIDHICKHIIDIDISYNLKPNLTLF
jgi:hypothetical protein